MFKVSFSKRFVSGVLEGITVTESIPYPGPMLAANVASGIERDAELGTVRKQCAGGGTYVIVPGTARVEA